MSQTVVVGDSSNDLDMIIGANLSFAVGNASQKVKEVADYVTDHIHDEGIYNSLKKFNII